MKKILFLSLLASILLANNYIQESTPLIQDGKEVGSLIIGTNVDVLKSDENSSEVKIKGYRPAGGKIVYDTLGVLSTSAVLINDEDNILKILGVEEDEYENEWQIVELTAAIDKTKIEDIDIIAEQGQRLFEERCGICHALHSYDEFSKNVWPSTIKSMQDNASLNEDEYFLIVKFLQRMAPGDDE